MTRLEGSNIVRVINFNSPVLVLGLLALAIGAQGGSTSGQVIVSKEHRDSVLDDAEGGAAGGDVCIDGNECTDDTVNQLGECVFRNNSNPCNDFSLCTTEDRCSNGSCIGITIDCNDHNECTNDSCIPSSGCVHVNNSNSCDDGIFCNGRETCRGGICDLHSGNPCPPNVVCDEATQSCGLTSLISFNAVKINDVPITPGACNLASVPPRCSTGNVDKLCASDDECHVGTGFLLPNRCAGGPNVNLHCSTNENCPGSTCISVIAGDVIEVEFFLSRWATELPTGVRLFQVKLNETGFIGSDNGTVLPMGWCAPVNRIDCTDSSTCPSTYPICSQTWGCTCAGHDPNLGAFMTTSRTDYLLNDPVGFDTIDAVVTTSLNFRYFALAIENVGVQDSGVPRYLGTLILKVSANACGTFIIGFVQEVSSTFIVDPSLKPIASLPTLRPLLLTVSDCSRQLLSCNPHHCNIDARSAHDRLDRNAKKNTNQMAMTFNKFTTGMTAADFEVTVVPFLPDAEDDDARSIISVTPNVLDPTSTTLTLNNPIRQTRWTCIRDKGSNKRCCMGSLPADADNSRISQPSDMFEIVDNLKGCLNPPDCSEPPLPVERCDLDHSLRCTGADLLMAADLLNGADAFDPVRGHMLPQLVPSCPDMRLPP